MPRTYDPAELNGEKTFHVEDRFAPDFSEGFYGLGQHQSGMFNYRGSTVELAQTESDAARARTLLDTGSGTREAVEQADARVRGLREAIKSAQAASRAAQVGRRRCMVASLPVGGVCGGKRIR